MKKIANLEECQKIFKDYLVKSIDINFLDENINEIIKYFLLSDGKRLRPMLALATFSMYSDDYEKILPFASCIEYIHNYSLIHDDLPCMDNDDFRRGKETVHKKFGQDMAVLTGDALLNTAFEMALKHIDNLKDIEEIKSSIKALKLIASKSGANGMIKGQVIDIKDNSNTIDEIKDMYDLKTSNLFTSSIISGAIIANCDKNELDLLDEFSIYFGRVFQLIDDIDDYENDLKQGKLSFATEYGIDKTIQIAETSFEKCIDVLETLEKTYSRNINIMLEIIKPLKTFLINKKNGGYK